MKTEENKWLTDFPNKEGNYWFYGNPFLGSMGIDFRDDSPPVEPKMYFVEVIAISNGLSLMGITSGQIITLRKFTKLQSHEGYVGYWLKADVPSLPLDKEKLFKLKVEAIY